MAIRLNPIERQVIVITGATSGIGLATARKAVERGARVVAAARGEEGLARLMDDLHRRGGEAIGVQADVAREADVRRIGDAAIDAFGRVDS